MLTHRFRLLARLALTIAAAAFAPGCGPTRPTPAVDGPCMDCTMAACQTQMNACLDDKRCKGAYDCVAACRVGADGVPDMACAQGCVEAAGGLEWLLTMSAGCGLAECERVCAQP